MSIVQKMTADLKGESEEIEVYSNHARETYKVAPFTDEQEVRFHQLARFTETSEFNSIWRTRSTKNRAVEISECYPDWAKEVIYFLREVTNIRSYAPAIELLNALRIKRHEIYVKHEVNAFKKNTEYHAKTSNAARKKQLLEEKQNVLEEIEHYKKIIEQAEIQLAGVKKLEFALEPIYLKGRAYQITNFDEDGQNQYIKIRISYDSDEEAIERFAEHIFTPAPRSAEDAKQLYEYFEEANSEVFSPIFSNLRALNGGKTAILQNQASIKKAQELLASVDEQLKRVEELEALHDETRSKVH